MSSCHLPLPRAAPDLGLWELGVDTPSSLHRGPLQGSALCGWGPFTNCTRSHPRSSHVFPSQLRSPPSSLTPSLWDHFQIHPQLVLLSALRQSLVQSLASPVMAPYSHAALRSLLLPQPHTSLQKSLVTPSPLLTTLSWFPTAGRTQEVRSDKAAVASCKVSSSLPHPTHLLLSGTSPPRGPAPTDQRHSQPRAGLRAVCVSLPHLILLCPCSVKA